MLKDMLGNEIKVGSWVALPTRASSSLWLIIRQVVEIGEQDGAVWDATEQKHALIKIPCGYYLTAHADIPEEGAPGRKERLLTERCVVVQRDGHPER